VSATPLEPAWLDRALYPFAPHHAQVRDGRMHYVDEGRGPVVLFVHGTPSWSFEWRHLIRALASSHRCVAPDLLGFGLSERPRAFGYTPADHARALADFVAALRLERFALVVHDFGGPIGLPLCLEHPERVTHLALLNTWMWSFADDPQMARAGRLIGGGLGRLLYRALNLSPRVILRQAWRRRETLTAAVHRHYLAPFPDWWSREHVLWTLARELLGSSDYYAALWSRRERLLGRPTAVVWGLADPAFRPDHLARWRGALPDARVAGLPGVGHWPQEEAHEVVARELTALLAASPRRD